MRREARHPREAVRPLRVEADVVQGGHQVGLVGDVGVVERGQPAEADQPVHHEVGDDEDVGADVVAPAQRLPDPGEVLLVVVDVLAVVHGEAALGLEQPDGLLVDVEGPVGDAQRCRRSVGVKSAARRRRVLTATVPAVAASRRAVGPRVAPSSEPADGAGAPDTARPGTGGRLMPDQLGIAAVSGVWSLMGVTPGHRARRGRRGRHRVRPRRGPAGQSPRRGLPADPDLVAGPQHRQLPGRGRCGPGPRCRPGRSPARRTTGPWNTRLVTVTAHGEVGVRMPRRRRPGSARDGP